MLNVDYFATYSSFRYFYVPPKMRDNLFEVIGTGILLNIIEKVSFIRSLK